MATPKSRRTPLKPDGFQGPSGCRGCFWHRWARRKAFATVWHSALVSGPGGAAPLLIDSSCRLQSASTWSHFGPESDVLGAFLVISDGFQASFGFFWLM